MSTSVFKPIALDIPRMRSPLADRRQLKEAFTRVRRVLFEPIDHVETQEFLERELAKHSVRQFKKWDFNFAKETPLANPTRYEWTAVVQARPVVKEAPKKRRFSVEDESADLYATFDEVDQENKTQERVMPIDEEERVESPPKKQRLITDFMSSRKLPIGPKAVKSAPLEKPTVPKPCNVPAR